MPEPKPQTLSELLYRSYANLWMAIKALEGKQKSYIQLHYIIRNKLYHGLKNWKMNVRSLFFNEKNKLHSDKVCVYCLTPNNLSIDHLIPKNKWWTDEWANLILACKNCNSSKNDTDLMKWYSNKENFPPLKILETYLKLVIKYSVENNLMEEKIENLRNLDLPFKIDFIPTKFPKPDLLRD